jgi:sugar phosphate isomerase/epimerase
MKFAFTTQCRSDRDFATTAAKARQCGYDGVEISGVGAPDGPLGLRLDDPARNLEVLGSFVSAAVEIPCITAPVRYAGNRHADERSAEAMLRWIDLAAELVCPRVMIRDPQIRRGQSRGAAGMALGDWLVPSADHALACGITLLVCNNSTLTSAGEMWTMLERLQHPAAACCWDLPNADRAGESPAVSVPTLNSRIQYARVGDVEPAPATPIAMATARLGAGNAHLELFLTRLRGIGYDGYVTLAGCSSASTDLEAALEVLKMGSSSEPGQRETRPKAG